MKQCIYENASGFSYDELTSIKTFDGRVRYCKQYLQKLGAGSSRIVFSLPNGHALKLASNRKGLAQNEQEHLNDVYAHTLGIVPVVYAGADDESWIEVEQAERIKPIDFYYLTGVQMPDFFEFIIASGYFRGTHIRPQFGHLSQEEYVDMLYNHPDLEDWDEYIANTDPVINDMLSIRQYGKVTRKGEEQLVLVDHGLTDDIFKQYYAKRLQ